MCKNLSREKYFQKFIHISALLLPLISLYTSSIHGSDNSQPIFSRTLHRSHFEGKLLKARQPNSGTTGFKVASFRNFFIWTFLHSILKNSNFGTIRISALLLNCKWIKVSLWKDLVNAFLNNLLTCHFKTLFTLFNTKNDSVTNTSGLKRTHFSKKCPFLGAF